jgi:hopene-associated glycosyltransferase HpnB
MLIVAIAALCLALWAYLLGARGGFWLASLRDAGRPSAPPAWPPVAAVIPARNEAEFIAESIKSLLRQDYLGPLAIIVVDDDSTDATAALARQAGAAAPANRSVTVVESHGPPAGWTGKLWALNQGIAAAEAAAVSPQLVWLTDADIAHAPDTLCWLVARSRAGGAVLTSLMAKLRCQSWAERIHVPAFIFFFQMLYPFRWVARPKARTAAAAGGCMLVEAQALRQIGGIESLRNDLIDDCALARRLKRRGPIWLGLTERVRSLRRYEDLDEVRSMISRTAYAQLGYSPIQLAGTVAGMSLVFLAPPLLALLAEGAARWMGLAAYLAMVLAFQPVLRFYRRSPLWGLGLPVIALLYMFYTLDSAYRHARRRGGQWKGRVHVDAPSLQ